jgi:hypothetical protein
MKTRLRIPKKTPAPVIKTAHSSQLVQTRPFPVSTNFNNDQSELRSIQEDVTPSALNLEQISVNAPGSEPLAPIQAKMTIGEPGDQYEQEADQMASQVVNQINQPANIQRQNPEEEELQMKPDNIQRQNPEEEELQMKPDNIQRQEEEELQMKPANIQRQNPEEEELQMKPDNIQRQEEEEELQMKPANIQRDDRGAMSASPNIEGSIQSQKGKGTSLEPVVQEKMENAFNADFSGVKIHHNQESDHLNQSIQARAFTTGQDLFFRQGAYEPSSRNGQELLAHELTHVVQQNGSAVQKKKD